MADCIDAHIRLLPPSEGRRTPIFPCTKGRHAYRPHFRVDAGEPLGVTFINGPEILAPGQEADVTVALVYWDTAADYSALQPGVSFEVLEGTRRVGTGSVLRRYRGPEDQ